jgi:NADH-quinone oxidoreductase subunit H
MDSALLLEKSILVAILTLITLGIAAYSTYGERKVAAFMQDRIGPNRAGKFGLLQPLADAGKLFFKEEFIPVQAEKWLFILGPAVAMVTATITSAVIPWGTEIPMFGRNVQLQVADVNIGVLYIMGVVSVGVYGIMIGGWASNNKYSLFGAIRASAQMISYELSMGLIVLSVVLFVGSFNLTEIVLFQKEGWFIIKLLPLGILFFIVGIAETNRHPFDLPESEAEIVSGYHTEYSSMKLGFYLFSEYINMFISSVIMSTLFFGGYDIPFFDESVLAPNLAAILGIVALMTKVIAFIFLFMWVRWTIPRFRYDQLMHLGWRILIPLALFNMLATGGVILYFNK